MGGLGGQRRDSGIGITEMGLGQEECRDGGPGEEGA